jgi:hypothetical protein
VKSRTHRPIQDFDPNSKAGATDKIGAKPAEKRHVIAEGVLVRKTGQLGKLVRPVDIDDPPGAGPQSSGSENRLEIGIEPRIDTSRPVRHGNIRKKYRSKVDDGTASTHAGKHRERTLRPSARHARSEVLSDATPARRTRAPDPRTVFFGARDTVRNRFAGQAIHKNPIIIAIQLR